MHVQRSTLYFMCGKMAAGKSTHARALAQAKKAVLLVQDEFLGALYPGEIREIGDFVKYSARLRGALSPHIQDLLSQGIPVVLDFPANTRAQRQWFRDLLRNVSVDHELHFVDVSDARCKLQLKRRSAALPAGSPWTTEDEFDAITAYFQAPADDEGFNVIRHAQAQFAAAADHRESVRGSSAADGTASPEDAGADAACGVAIQGEPFMSDLKKGSCLCGRVQFTVAGELPGPDACHCAQCRKQSGHYFVSTNVPRTALVVTGEDALTWYQSSAKVRRGFCSTCGSSLFWDPPARDWTSVAMGAFDTPTATRLAMHIFVAEKGDYYEITDDLPQNER